MGSNSNRILMAVLTGLFLALTAFLLQSVESHILFKEQEAGKDFNIIGADAPAPVEVAAVAEPICSLLADADAAVGATIAQANCAACHQFNNEVNGTGPHLVNIVGRDVANVDSFAYSSAMASFGGQWTHEELNEFLFKPTAYIQGTKMNFSGWDNSKTRLRANVIAYLYDISDAPLPECEGEAHMMDAADTGEADETETEAGETETPATDMMGGDTAN